MSIYTSLKSPHSRSHLLLFIFKRSCIKSNQLWMYSSMSSEAWRVMWPPPGWVVMDIEPSHHAPNTSPVCSLRVAHHPSCTLGNYRSVTHSLSSRECHRNGMVQYVTFRGWVLSLSTTRLTLIQAASCTAALPLCPLLLNMKVLAALLNIYQPLLLLASTFCLAGMPKELSVTGA